MQVHRSMRTNHFLFANQTTMAEKRRSGVSGILSDSKPAKPDTETEFLSQLGVGVLLRGALLKLAEVRPEDPIAFLADHFGNLASESENGAAGCGDAEQQNTQEQQQLERALWHLRLAHHSQRSAFNNNVRVAYELLVQSGQRPRVGGGVRGKIYAEMLRCLCREGEVPEATAAPLLRRIQCHDHEAVPFELFRQGVLTCAVFSDYVRKSRSLYASVCHPCPETPAERALCQAVLGTLRDALDTSDCADSARFLEASAKIAPCKLAEAMASARSPAGPQTGPTMDAREFEDAAAALFITRVRPTS
ncbi:hypothetical protein AAFF_G00307130 [Aldrovandia affinis]|uniref:Tubulin polyglutamylase complex subunit 1-like C-terminal domain-containing protein n=1 Tax=Aldrovandia affinis TaxID=143900 RepID=A0AAD7R8H6_9TELE|nr:hypothetical protein AAFF_G00307130 [Aldrovandia affinis]